MSTLVVNDVGTELSYIDSGVPSGTKDYVTIFAIHGTVFTGPIWNRVISLAPKSGVRFVAVNRRDYPGSTALSPEEINVLNSGTDDQKADFLKARGVEIATFISLFAEKHNLPAASADGTAGGFGIVGWSLGCAFALAAVAAVDALPVPAQALWKAGARALILQEPPTVSLGKAIPPDAWTPLVDQSMPAEARTAFFSHWITSYFKHGDLSSRDPKAISYVVPATSRAPTIYSLTEEEVKHSIYEPSAFGSDMAFMIFSALQIAATYKKAVFDRDLRALVPNLKVTVFSGDATASFSIPSQWEVEDDDKAAGGGFVTVKWIPGFNHLAHVDEPAATLQVYKDAF
ncbi:hypothetical protein BD309DRAFT_1022138 [Dichomitus squalens]|uniref:AB hydrolase-1 domain-containing protein n=1 Tax=Dichomitus squalens TaxID=114155 RepID=A0A4Q9MPF2_9APHY|nr:hypothetical protein BD311DRAFT_778521 [Dichomitus squalens]TBU39455.1 hypothetical protein BD309DRAFT_1022138 [Dichomitus squalens]TBU60135.1 hypothetical protein BD310DRAFT_976091 [Dichomitus squalens]